MVSGKRRKVGRPKGLPNKWALLIGSKRKITQVLTGEVLPPPERLADDVLKGATAISEWSGLTVSQVYNKKVVLGLRSLGETPEAA
jgi:hypothetical protein